MGVVRGCGTRKAGGIYAECPGSPFGEPVEAFLIDPPSLLPDTMELAPQGVMLIERAGVWHVVDWVGESHYPNVADFIEEVRQFGVSRRLPQSLEYEKLTVESRLLLVHRKAWIEAWAQYPWVACPQDRPEHDRRVEGPCAGTWWMDVVGGEYAMTWIHKGQEESTRTAVKRTMPSFNYVAYQRPEVVTDPGYRPAFFASFPVHNLTVIRDPVGNRHELSILQAAKAGVPVALEEE